MKKEQFFELLGELDDNLITNAKLPLKKNRNKRAWGAIAACLALVLCIGAFVVYIHLNDASEPVIADLAPMVYVNDTLYKQSSDQKGYPERKDEFHYLGKILTDCPADGVPKENFQANHPIVGCEVYQYGEHIVVKIKDAYWLYLKYGRPEVNWDELGETEPPDHAQGE